MTESILAGAIFLFACALASAHIETTAICSDDEWQCRNGNCILKHYVCDGWNHCTDWSDELDPETGKCPPCPPKFIQCPETGKCFRSFQYCDGDNQCGNWWDEREEICPCSSDTVRCPTAPTIHPAPPRACIPPEYFCDAEGIWDCADGSDEVNCTSTHKSL